MADITQTPDNVTYSGTVTIVQRQAGAAITAGDIVYEDAADGRKWKPASASTATTAAAVAMALSSCADDQHFAAVLLQDGISINPGGTVVVGQDYGVSANAGNIAPTSDWTTNDYMTVLGIGVSASLIRIKANATGVQHP